MEIDKIQAVVRTNRGKNAMRRLRNSGRIPANFYGPNYETIAIDIDAIKFDKALSKRKSLYNLSIAEKGEFEVIFREIQRDPVSEKIQHVDLYGITRGQKITSTVPIKVVGVPIGVRQSGGILEVIRRQIEVECLPKDIPEYIIIDVTDINVGESFHVGDIKVENVEFLLDEKMSIAAVVQPTVVKVAASDLVEEAEGEEVESEEESSEKE